MSISIRISQFGKHVEEISNCDNEYDFQRNKQIET